MATPSYGGTQRSYGSSTTSRILKRDQHRCYLCGAPASEVDHVINIAAGGSDEDHNLAAICIPCHRSKTKREQQAGRQRRAALARLPREQHPNHPGG